MRQGELMSELAGGTNQVIAKFASHCAVDTRQIAGKWLLKYWDQIKTTGLVIGLNGNLGAGKTVLTQGVGQFLKISDQIVSPTYNYILEYKFNRHGFSGFLQHVDAWKINDLADYQRLKLAKLVQPGTILIIEWWSQVAEFCLSQKDGFSQQLSILAIDIKVTGETDRDLTIQIVRTGKN
jgi:tRNA threonylcarbamoyl adenosine modification protein YjeE